MEYETGHPFPAEETGGEKGYSVQETELIRELVKARMEQKLELEYESFQGYELPPRTQFSMLNKPAVSIKYGKITFNMACIRMFMGVKFIELPVNPQKKRLAVITCAEEESSSVAWARVKKDAWVNKTISSLEFCEKLYRLMGWDRNCRYKVLGRVANSDKGLIMLFDLAEAIMFTALPEEYVDKRTGEVKKRQIKYYPDEYKDRIGRSYNDYIATQQMSLFEQFEGYVGNTYQDGANVQAPGTIGSADLV